MTLGRSFVFLQVSHTLPVKAPVGRLGRGCRMAGDTETHSRDTAKPEYGKGLLWPRER